MKSIIRQIYGGNLDPSNLCRGHSETNLTAQEKYKKYDAIFSNKLRQIDPSLVNEYNKVIDAHFEVYATGDEDIFETGFCLGAKLMSEIMNSSSLVNIECEDDDDDDCEEDDDSEEY